MFLQVKACVTIEYWFIENELLQSDGGAGRDEGEGGRGRNLWLHVKGEEKS